MLIGQKVQLRQIEDKDTDLIVKWRNNENVIKNFFIQEILTPQQHKWWLENRVKTGQVAQFIITDKQTGQAVGSTFLRDIDNKNKKAEFGIFIGEDCARGKGFGTEAAQLICNYGFEGLNLHRIFLRVFSHNKQAIYSYEKSGFIYEATLKDDICINNEFFDVVIMAKLNIKEVL